MKHNEKSANRRALPKFLGVLLLSGLIGGIIGFMAGFVGDTSLPDQIVASIHTMLRVITPWSILVFSVLLQGLGFGQYHSAKKLFLAWDGEEEETIERAEEKLSWVVMLSSLNMVVDFFFFGIAFQGVDIENTALRVLFFLSFFLSFAGILLLQQKMVDLTKKMNPEKRGSVYDLKFQEKRMDSCDENEQRQIGQAAYKAFNTVNHTAVILWVALLVLSLPFDIGVLPFFLVALIFGVNQVAYLLESIRLSRRKP